MTPEEADSAQQWKGMDGAIAWHLIERHADDWSEVGEMMNAWLRAKVKDAVEEERAACVNICVEQAVLQDSAFRFGLTPTDGDLADKCAEGIKARQDNLRKPT